jgi:hypothetical protein
VGPSVTLEVMEKRKMFDPAGNRIPAAHAKAMKRIGSGIFQGSTPKFDWEDMRISVAPGEGSYRVPLVYTSEMLPPEPGVSVPACHRAGTEQKETCCSCLAADSTGRH